MIKDKLAVVAEWKKICAPSGPDPVRLPEGGSQQGKSPGLPLVFYVTPNKLITKNAFHAQPCKGEEGVTLSERLSHNGRNVIIEVVEV